MSQIGLTSRLASAPNGIDTNGEQPGARWKRTQVDTPNSIPDPEVLHSIYILKLQLATAERDLDGLMNLIVLHAEQLTSANGAVIELRDGAEMYYRAASGVGAPHVGLRLPVRGSLSGTCAVTGEILRCNDTETDSRVNREACRKIGVRSMVLMPLKMGNNVVGVLKVLHATPSAFGPDTVSILRLMADFLGAAMVGAITEAG